MSSFEHIRRVPRRRSRRQRDPRGSAPRRRKRRNLIKFIPSADTDFAFTANNFVCYLQQNPEMYGLTAEQVDSIDSAVTAFRSALAASLHVNTRTKQTISKKDTARKRAETIVRQYANIIRAHPDVTPSHKELLRIKERPKKLKQRNCPLTAPVLLFEGSIEGQAGGIGAGAGSGMHKLSFWDQHVFGQKYRAKPEGVVRLELFVDLVPEGEPIPQHPFERRGGMGGWYLRSFGKSPIRVEYPRPIGGGSMLVVYWGRWADATGDFGMFSKTCVARPEGWTDHSASLRALPEAGGAIEKQRVETKYVFIQAPYQLPVQAEEHEPSLKIPLLQCAQMQPALLPAAQEKAPRC